MPDLRKTYQTFSVGTTFYFLLQLLPVLTNSVFAGR